MILATLANSAIGTAAAFAMFGGMVHPEIWLWEALSLVLAAATFVTIAGLAALDA